MFPQFHAMEKRKNDFLITSICNSIGRNRSRDLSCGFESHHMQIYEFKIMINKHIYNKDL